MSTLIRPPQGFLFSPTKHDPSLAGEERRLWQGYEQAPLGDRFVRLQDLNGFYMRQFGRGGAAGLRWVESAKEALVQNVRTENTYSQFLTFQTDGTGLLRLPPDFPKPVVLRMEERGSYPVVIHLEGQAISGLGYLAYFHIPSLVLIQDIVSEESVAFLKERLKSGEGFDPVIISDDRQKNRFILDKGYKRTFTASQDRYPYILGRVMKRYPFLGKEYRFEEFRVVSQEEYDRSATAGRLEKQVSDSLKTGLE
jgi:hypothetical protein